MDSLNLLNSYVSCKINKKESLDKDKIQILLIRIGVTNPLHLCMSFTTSVYSKTKLLYLLHQNHISLFGHLKFIE